jgi:uncharacterized membrane protein
MATQEYIFPVIATFEEAWQKVRGSKTVIFALLATIAAIVLVSGLLGGFLQIFTNKAVATIPVIIGAILQLFLAWGIMYIGIERAANLHVNYAMVRSVFDLRLFGKMIALYVLEFLVILPTMILLVPSILLQKYAGTSLAAHLIAVTLAIVWDAVVLYLVLRMSVSKAIVIAERSNPISAIKTSFKATEGNVWRIFGFIFLNLLIVGLSIIPFGIGLIWSIPLLLISYGLMYRKLVVLREIKV